MTNLSEIIKHLTPEEQARTWSLLADWKDEPMSQRELAAFVMGMMRVFKMCGTYNMHIELVTIAEVHRLLDMEQIEYNENLVAADGMARSIPGRRDHFT